MSVPVWVCHYLSHPVTFGAVPTPGTDRLTHARGKNLGVGIFKSEDLIMHHGRSPYMYWRSGCLGSNLCWSIFISPILLHLNNYESDSQYTFKKLNHQLWRLFRSIKRLKIMLLFEIVPCLFKWSDCGVTNWKMKRKLGQ